MFKIKTAQNWASNRIISNWLFLSAGLIFFMILLGGWTRLTGSGLSMVHWKPTSFFPPFTEAEWTTVFNHYKNSPEYQQVNFGMSLQEFKNIFWLEYFHRLCARLIGLIFLIPLGLSILNPSLSRGFSLGILGIWALGALQGVLGWYMVKSGLIKDPHVSPYRLGAHLLLAFLTYALVLRAGLFLRGYPFKSFQNILYYVSFFCVILTVFYGALVAGLKAGLIYNTFPLMNGEWTPEGLLDLTPVWRNFFENPGTVQFIHRVLGMSTLLLIGAYWIKTPSLSHENKFGFLALILALAQVGLGILTLLYHIPLELASLHQANAVLLFTILFGILFQKKESNS